MSDVVTVYLTKEQIYRLVEVANNALVGVQIHTDASDLSSLNCEAVQIDDIQVMRCFQIGHLGEMEETT